MENPCHHRDLLKDMFALKNEFGLKETRDFRVPKKWKGQLKKIRACIIWHFHYSLYRSQTVSGSPQSIYTPCHHTQNRPRSLSRRQFPVRHSESSCLFKLRKMQLKKRH